MTLNEIRVGESIVEAQSLIKEMFFTNLEDLEVLEPAVSEDSRHVPHLPHRLVVSAARGAKTQQPAAEARRQRACQDIKNLTNAESRPLREKAFCAAAAGP